VTKRRVAYVVNHVAFFVSHRLPLAIGAQQCGFTVCLMTGQAGSKEMEAAAVAKLLGACIPHKRTVFRSSSVNPLRELLGLFQLVWFLVRFQPNVVHCVSPKGVLYGGIAARICRVRGLVLAISGMGYAFTDAPEQGVGRALMRRVYSVLVKFAFNHPNVITIVQNKDDYQSLIDNRLTQPKSMVLIPGSGVDLTLFERCSPSKKAPIVLLPARMIKDKGIHEFVDAVRQIKAIVPEWRFLLAGAADYDSPSAIGVDQLKVWQAEGCVEWVGHVDNMLSLYNQAAIVCLPSFYREGIPKALLEAAAAGCAVVTTDVTGCREALVPGVTGDLVPPRDSASLAETLLSLIKDEFRRKAYGAKGQERARAIFSIESVVSRTLGVYEELLRDE
jgi:glycosyltransferase involved in cell wall biosynthesis